MIKNSILEELIATGMTEHFIHDRIYQKIALTPADLRLCQTREPVRLRHISLSAVPPWMIPAGVAASRFEHTMGVVHLAKIVGERDEFQEIANNLVLAAFAHDLGAPPFSHLSEYFMVKLMGKNHEEFGEEAIAGGEFAEEVKRQGGNIGRVLSFVNSREKPFSDIINGTIDIDNLDNTLRYSLSLGLLQNSPYSPEELARAYAFRDGKLVLLGEYTSGLSGWERTRELTYEFVYGQANMSTGTMLFRALDFARREGELRKDFFLMTDEEAFTYLANKCNIKTRTLMDRANRWIFYPMVFSFRSADVGENLVSYVLDSDNRGRLADEISGQLKIAPEDVCVYMGKDRGFKKIHLPIVDGDQDLEHHPKNSLAYMVQVYLHPKWADKASAAKEVASNQIYSTFSV